MKAMETDRLCLELWSKSDNEALYEYAKNPNVGPCAGWKPHASPEESRQVIEDVFLRCESWKIIWKKSGKIIGIVGLEEDRLRPEVASRELGYSLAEEFWGRGIMTEAAGKVIEYAFTFMDLDIIAVQTSPINIRSQKVIEKLGFKKEGHLRYTNRIYDGTVRDAYLYSLCKNEWEALEKSGREKG